VPIESAGLAALNILLDGAFIDGVRRPLATPRRDQFRRLRAVF
jgi:hypothetical protein